MDVVVCCLLAFEKKYFFGFFFKKLDLVEMNIYFEIDRQIYLKEQFWNKDSLNCKFQFFKAVFLVFFVYINSLHYALLDLNLNLYTAGEL